LLRRVKRYLDGYMPMPAIATLSPRQPDQVVTHHRCTGIRTTKGGEMAAGGG
jgi:hypothetical protein